jgi:hypothetical protein
MQDDQDTSVPRPYDARSAFGPLLRFIRMSRPYGLRTVAFGSEESYRKLAERLADNGDLARDDIDRFVVELTEHVVPIHSFGGSAVYECIASDLDPDASIRTTSAGDGGNR